MEKSKISNEYLNAKLDIILQYMFAVQESIQTSQSERMNAHIKNQEWFDNVQKQLDDYFIKGRNKNGP